MKRFTTRASHRARAGVTSAPRWTFTMLTIPSRVEYLARLLHSMAEMPSADRIDVVVIFNAATDEEPLAIEQRICAMAPSLPIRVYVNSHEPSIGSGRRMQLSVCRTPLVAFIDDDLTVHGDVIGTIEDTLRSTPLGIVGQPS